MKKNYVIIMLILISIIIAGWFYYINKEKSNPLILNKDCEIQNNIVICVSEIADEKLNILVNVTKETKVEPFSICDVRLVRIEKKNNSNWQEVDTWGYYGKGCLYFIDRELTEEEINSRCWGTDYCPSIIESIGPEDSVSFIWSKRQFKWDDPYSRNARTNPEKIPVDAGHYRINFHGYTKEFQIE
jgi:hypothetical protein